MQGPTRDAPLDAGRVARVVAEQFPDDAGPEPVRIGNPRGDQHWQIGSVVFRFPVRPERVAWLARHAGVLRVVEPALGELVPHFSRLGRPGGGFPFPFVGYARLPGVPAGSPGTDLTATAADLGTLLGVLHGSDAAGLPAEPGRPTRPARPDTEPGRHADLPADLPADLAAELAADLAAMAATLRGHLPLGLAGVVGDHLTGGSPPLPAPDERVLVHTDLAADHVLVAPDGRVTGLLGWAGAVVDDPALDFASLVGTDSWRFVAGALASYPRPVDGGFWERVRWLGRGFALRRLADALDAGDDPRRPLEAVRRAFDGDG